MTGAVPFDVFMNEALYGPGGFYSSDRGAGRERDFITSPELGPLFGAVVGNALDTWWEELDRPDPCIVVEAGAGRGALRDAVLAHVTAPIEYVTVEFDDAWPDRADVVIANELVDNLPFKIVERVGDGWVELLVADGAFTRGDRVSFELEAPPGERIPIHTRAREWTERARSTARRVCVFDYGTHTTAELIGRGWLRTYREHGRGGDPLRESGSQDVTCDVAFDQLGPDRLSTQAHWLRAHGIDTLVAAARETWGERASIGDLESLKARSRITEADALLDPAGLGGFLVAEWLR